MNDDEIGATRRGLLTTPPSVFDLYMAAALQGILASFTGDGSEGLSDYQLQNLIDSAEKVVLLALEARVRAQQMIGAE